MLKYGVIVVSYDNVFYRGLDEIRAKQLSAENIPFAVVYNGNGPTWQTREWEHYVKDNRMNPTMYNKFVYTANSLLNRSEWADLDYIIRINSSTFLNLKELSRIFIQLPKTQCYAGRPLETFPYFPTETPIKSLSISGVSGMYTFLSLDVIKTLFKYGLTNSIYNDDVTLGATMFDLKISRTLINDYLINVNDIPETPEKYYKALEYTFVRIKNETDRNLDLIHWNSLYNIYNKKYV